MDAREIITLQFGSFANHVGTHFWNIQESSFNYDPTDESSEINHDVMFREGRTSRNEVTFTPRLLLVDLKGSLQYYSKEGDLYQNLGEASNLDNYLEQIKGNVLWDSSSVEVIKETPAEKPEFQKDLSDAAAEPGKSYNLKENVKNWPDYLFTRYHPRTINIVNEFEYKEDYSTFDTYTSGLQLWKSQYFEEDFSDKIRNLVEECNNCQGFQTFFDAVDGFAGLSVKCLEYLEDDYSKCLFNVPVMPPTTKNSQFADEAMSDSIRIINLAFTYAKLADQSDLFIPLSTMGRCWRTPGEPRQFPYINYDPLNFYHSSGILATYLDTISLRYRSKNPSASNFLSGFCSDLNGYGRKMASGRLALPFPMRENEDLIDMLDHFEGELMQSVSPGTSVGTDRIIQSVCVRGIPKDRLKRPIANAKLQQQMAAYRCDSTSEMLQLYFQCNNYASLSHVSASEKAVNLKAPFPMEFFDSRLNGKGFLREFVNENVEKIPTVPIMATAQTSADLANTLETLHTNVKRIKIAKIPRCLDAGLDMEEYEEMLERLLTFKEQYEENFHL